MSSKRAAEEETGDSASIQGVQKKQKTNAVLIKPLSKSQKMTLLNESLIKKVQNEVNKDPLCNLKSIFDQYELDVENIYMDGN